MANHEYTFTDYQNAVAHALGGAPSSTTSAADIVHDAMAYVCDYYPWNWLKKELSLATVSSQSYIVLPADFKQIQNAIRYSMTNLLIPATLEDIHLLRAQAGIANTFNTYYAIGITDQATVTATPLYRIEIFPTPTASTSGAITGTYLKLVPKMSGGTDKPNIPPSWHPALKAVCRAKAISDQFHEDSSDWQQAKAQLDALVAIDDGQQPSLGMMRGAVGVARWRDSDLPRNLNGTITTP